MKKLTALLLALLLALLAAGCGSDSLDTHIYFNFESADVAQAEMFRYAGAASAGRLFRGADRARRDVQPALHHAGRRHP